MISRILKERFGLRVSKEDRKAALGNADAALADWCMNLPDSLQMQTSEMNVWSSSLHLTYSNFLILLHRPHPRAVKGSDDYGPNDSDICGTAANTITSIFETLRSRDMIKYLWISDINALFTAMMQVSVELRFSNPVLAINALRRFDSSLLSLRRLADYWINAELILRIFEESSHLQHGIRLGEKIQEQSPPDNSQSTWGANDASALEKVQQGGIERSGLEVLTGTALTAIDSTSALNNDVRDTDSWRDLFPPTNDSTPENLLLPDDLPMDSEWREIYWQEPGMTEVVGGIWGWS